MAQDLAGKPEFCTATRALCQRRGLNAELQHFLLDKGSEFSYKAISLAPKPSGGIS